MEEDERKEELEEREAGHPKIPATKKSGKETKKHLEEDLLNKAAKLKKKKGKQKIKKAIKVKAFVRRK